MEWHWHGKPQGVKQEQLRDALEVLSNVRLQARAARGASSCKPLFGGTRT